LVLQDDEQIANILADFERRGRLARARFAARTPRRAGDVVADVIRVRGYARVTSQRTLEKAWRQAVAEIVSGVAATSASRPGNVRRGVLMVWVANSAVNQELTFQKRALLARLGELLPEARLRDLRIRVGKMC
jgi:predicted nucleic acid-binding Zn ribbon protein